MSRRQQQQHEQSLRFRTSLAPAPASLFAGVDANAAPPARINLALSGWLQDRFPPLPLPLASLSSSSSTSAAAAAAAGVAPASSSSSPAPAYVTTNLRFELAAVRPTFPVRTGKKGAAAANDDDDDDDDFDDDDDYKDLRGGAASRAAIAGGGLVGAAVEAAERRARAGRALPEASDRAVAALERVRCGGCDGPLVPSPGETSQPRRRRAAALARVCAGCRRAYHSPCAREVGALLGGRTLLRLAPGQPPPWENPQGHGGLLAALTGHGGRRQQDKQEEQEGVTEELERLVREEEEVKAAVARDGHWFHSFPCARVAAALAAQAAVGPVAIDEAPPPDAAAGEGRGDEQGGGGANNASANAAAALSSSASPSPFAWLKGMREAAMRRLPVDDTEEFEFDTEADDVEDGDLPDGRRRRRRRQQARPAPPPAEEEAPPPPTRPPTPSPSSRTWALVDLSRLRAEPGDPPGRTGPGSRLRPDVDALIDVLMQSYGPGAADEVIGLTASAAAAEREEDEARDREAAARRRAAEAAAAAAAAEGGAAVAPATPAARRRRIGGGLRDGRYAVLLRDSADRGADPLCAALLESYGPEAAVVGLVATRVSRRGEGHAAALLDATAAFLRDGAGARRLLAAGVPAASDPVCEGLFLGQGGEAAVKREQARVQAELRRQNKMGGGGGADDDGDLVAGLLAITGSPSLVPYVSKEKIYWSPPHAPRFRRLTRGEARGLAAGLPALGRRLEATGALGRPRRGVGRVVGWLFGRGGGKAVTEDGREWLVKDLR